MPTVCFFNGKLMHRPDNYKYWILLICPVGVRSSRNQQDEQTKDSKREIETQGHQR